MFVHDVTLLTIIIRYSVWLIGYFFQCRVPW